MVRLWTWEALAHGAEVVSYFRWRQCPFAQEQMHAGLNRPDRKLSPGGLEATQVGQELAQIGALPASTQAPVALVFDYETSWITRIQPQGRDFRYTDLAFRWYEAIRRLGLDVDFVRPGASLAGYKAVVVPSLAHVSDAAVQAFAATDAIILFGPRTGSKTRDFAIPDELPPGALQELLPLKVTQVASLRPNLAEPVEGPGLSGTIRRWREWLETELPVQASFADGAPALVGDGNRFYLAGWPDPALLRGVMADLLGSVGLPLTELPEAVRLRRRGGLTFAFNYGEIDWAAPVKDAGRYLLGGPVVPPQGVACWRAA